MSHHHSSAQNNIPAHERFVAYLEQEIHTQDYQRLHVRVSKGLHPPIEKLYDYATGVSTEQELSIIRDHLELCAGCAEEVLRIRLIEADIAPESQSALPFFREHLNEALPVTAVYDRNTPDLIHDYYQRPLLERLAASSGTASELTFPLTVEYADGQIVGEFWKRAGQLFYCLKKSAIENQSYTCTLRYTSSTNPSDVRIYELHEGEHKRIGDFREFVSSDTRQEMLNVMRQFQLVLLQKKS